MRSLRALGRVLLVVACTLLFAAPALADDDDLVRREGQRLAVPAAPGTPVYDYDLTWSEDGWRDADALVDDLKARAFPDDIRLVETRAAERTLRIRTTLDGRRSLDNAGARIAATGPTPEGPDDCRDVVVDLASHVRRIMVGKAAPCPGARELQPDREVVIEGLDAAGKPLFAAVSADRRWSVQETVDAAGRLRKLSEGRGPDVAQIVRFSARIGPELKRIRVWEYDPEGGRKPLGEAPWTGVGTSSP